MASVRVDFSSSVVVIYICVGPNLNIARTE